MMNTTDTDFASASLYSELRGILDEIIRSVNHASSETVENALRPTKETHHALREAATIAQRNLRESTDAVQSLQSCSTQLEKVLKEITQTATKAQASLDAVDRRMYKQREEWEDFSNKMDSIWQQRSKGIVVTMIVFDLLILMSVVCLFLLG